MRLSGRAHGSKGFAYVVTFCISLVLFLVPACVDHGDDHDDDHKKELRHSTDKQKEKKESSLASPVAQGAYRQECGACHHAYFPGLLPARSWEKLLANPSDHFGEQLPLSDSTLAEVRAYLAANAADNSGNKRSRKIMKSLGSSTPLRVSEIAYLRDKHHEVSAEVLQRKSVGGLGNCIACHKGAESGGFDDDNVVIPN